jgi:hypothetical protein
MIKVGSLEIKLKHLINADHVQDIKSQNNRSHRSS